MQLDFIVSGDSFDHVFRFDAKFNDVATINTDEFHLGWGPVAWTVAVQDPLICQTVHSGINKLTLLNVQGRSSGVWQWNVIGIWFVALAIEYEYA